MQTQTNNVKSKSEKLNKLWQQISLQGKVHIYTCNAIDTNCNGIFVCACVRACVRSETNKWVEATDMQENLKFKLQFLFYFRHSFHFSFCLTQFNSQGNQWHYLWMAWVCSDVLSACICGSLSVQLCKKLM